MWLLPFDLPAPAYHLQKLIDTLVIILNFGLFLLIFPYVVCNFIMIQSSPCDINISLPLLWLLFNVMNFNHFSTSRTHYLRTSTLPLVKVSWKITYLNPFNHMNILHIFTAICKFHIPLLYISCVFNPTCVNSILCCAHWYTYSRTNVYLYIFSQKV